MTAILLALLRIALFVPNPSVFWNPERTLKIYASGNEEVLNSCIQSGITVQYRFEMRYCHKRASWWDKCLEERVELHSLQYDPVNETYRIETDRFGDDKEREEALYPELGKAREKLVQVENIPLSFITRGADYQADGNHFIEIRIISECKEDISSKLLDVSYLLTFGLVKINRFNSGWVAFVLDKVS